MPFLIIHQCPRPERAGKRSVDMREILIVDDDVCIGDMLEEVLTGEGYGVVRAYSGTEALLLLDRRRPDLVLLDLMLPGLNGEEVLTRVEGIPVVVVSAKSDVDHKAALLLGGAADYLTKPFAMKELLARIAVALRSAQARGISPVLRFGGLSMDTGSHTLSAGGAEVRLTRTEYAILKLLLQNPDQVIPKSQMLDRISEDTPDCTDDSLKMHVSNLRRKLREVTGRDYIEAVWGIGFKLRSE